MKIDKDNILESILENISNVDYIRATDIPDIPLYMDQVTTFMDGKLLGSKRHEDDKILTKTMINNYAKNNLLPPPVKKKYDKEHVLVLIFIYYFKTILSIKDIETLLKPLTSKYFDTNQDFNICDIYTEALYMEKERIEVIKEDVLASYKKSQETFTDASNPDQEFLQLFSFICALSFDVYVKQQIIEGLLDSFPFDKFSE